MGREVKRAPIGFDIDAWYAEFGEPPSPPRCSSCRGTGRSWRGRVVYDLLGWRGELWLRKALGRDRGMGRCTACHGRGVEQGHDELEAAAEAWEPTEPPSGEGYVLWSTTVDAPMSPVLPTSDALARWLVDNRVSAFATRTATYEQWLEFIEGAGFAVSAVETSQGGVISGVEALSEHGLNDGVESPRRT